MKKFEEDELITRRKLHEDNEGYLKDILEDEEERLIKKISDRLSIEDKYLFFRYMALRDIIQEIKTA